MIEGQTFTIGSQHPNSFHVLVKPAMFESSFAFLADASAA
jgi:hypothetical protein